MLGSDYPFPLGENTPGELVRSAGTIPEKTRQLILADNAIAFFGIEPYVIARVKFIKSVAKQSSN